MLGMTVALAPVETSIVELRAWLTASEELLFSMSPADPAYKAGLAIWEARHDAYMARARAEGEPE
jgi:hypothetical protein